MPIVRSEGWQTEGGGSAPGQAFKVRSQEKLSNELEHLVVWFNVDRARNHSDSTS
jgi:hypothetical protein